MNDPVGFYPQTVNWRPIQRPLVKLVERRVRLPRQIDCRSGTRPGQAQGNPQYQQHEVTGIAARAEGRHLV